MHQIHHTQGFILKRAATGEASVRVWLYTRELGLVVATLQGVQKAGAKLSMQVRDYTRVSADLIRGKSIWRYISGTQLSDPLAGRLRSPLARAYVRTLEFLLRFVSDEDPSDELFDQVEAVAQILEEGTHDAAIVDALSLWRMLAVLGYIAPSDDMLVLLQTSFREALAHVGGGDRSRLIREATDAIKESHL